MTFLIRIFAIFVALGFLAKVSAASDNGCGRNDFSEEIIRGEKVIIFSDFPSFALISDPSCDYSESCSYTLGLRFGEKFEKNFESVQVNSLCKSISYSRGRFRTQNFVDSGGIKSGIKVKVREIKLNIAGLNRNIVLIKKERDFHPDNLGFVSPDFVGDFEGVFGGTSRVEFSIAIESP